MAASLPVVLSNFPNWRELIEEPNAGLCVDPADWDGIVSAIEWLHAHPEEAIEMGRNGRRAVQERFNWQSQANKLLKLYSTLLGRGASQPQPAIAGEAE
jgi:glycosyltransferase involved in cell wall biosynthesis